ncbi:caprin-2 isoform X2 [Alligator mississippiensis]|uniref:caprin-2 isoform X2 n=1 Tax=Alligator mississippiensis TaxID=8496 RepID=UPI002877E3CF|nr:caprin-2 isoform X2 [Alligator mississippiensis]
MVQLSQAQARCLSPSVLSEEGEDKSMKLAKQQVNQPGEGQPPLSPLQSALNSAANTAQAYETYIENGIICLKHKIRNIEKKKLKLEDYKDRLKKGEALNQDQLEAVEKYDEVVHNLEFAKELQKTFSGLSQDLLKAQRKAQRRENLVKLEAEKKKLRTILQVQYVLQNFTQEHVQKDFKGGLNGAIYLPSKELDYLIRFAKLTCPERNESLSVEDQMEQSSLYFWDLLEGSEKPVVGTTYGHLKELLSKLLDSGYFENVPAPHNAMPLKELEEEGLREPERTRQLSKRESAKDPECLMELMKSEIQPQEFLNRRYLPAAECSIKKKPEESKPREAEYARKKEPPKSWEMLLDIEEQEQNRESLKPWESRVVEEEKPSKSWETCVREEEEKQKQQETPKPWVTHAREEQDSSKPWVTRVREQQEQKKLESPKPWVAKARDEQEQKKQEPPKAWVTKVKEGPEQKQELPKPWGSQTREEPEQKQEPSKPWAAPRAKEEPEQKKQELPKPWAAPRAREESEQKKQELPKPWVPPHAREVPEQKQEPSKPWAPPRAKEVPEQKQEPSKPWAPPRAKEVPEQKQEPSKPWAPPRAKEVPEQKQEPSKPWAPPRAKEVPEQKKQELPKSWAPPHNREESGQKQEPPKAWETANRQQQELQQLQNPPKSLGAASVVPKDQIGPKKFDVEPKERRERRQKAELEVKQDGKADELSDEQGFDAVRKKEVSVGESCKLPRSLQSSVQVPKPVHQPAAEFCSTSTLPKDPVLRREKLQDLMTQIQGTYNFMQESILDFDKASPSAIVSSQPPSVSPAGSPVASKEQKLLSQNDFLQQPLQTAASPITLHGSNTSLASADQTLSGSETEDLVMPQTTQTSVPLSQETEKYTSPQPLYQTNSRISEPLIPQKMEVTQATIPLSSESQSPLPSSTSMSPVPQGQTFQSPPASSSSVTITAAPFQAMQTVFKVNAPLPPRKEQEIKEDSSYTAGYNQSFSTASTQTPPQCQLQSTHTAEQNSVSQESLPTVNYQPDGVVPVSNGSLAFYPAQTVIPRPAQPYLNSRGSVRGSTRGGRSLANSYRSPGGYKGFDAYRGSPSIVNGNYGQLQFPSRDYSGIPYSQKDINYQQCYKRGGIISGPRANSRGWSDSSQVSSPERDNETFNSGDSGQGDSRSITPVDVPVTSQAATILPVHVYPLPQQMRVAFSAARTSNLAPGTLDQPIAFDLLLNNLGETFDIQLGRFNCPVNGTYVFIFHMLKLAVNVPLYVNLMKNEEVLVSAYANDGAPDHETASNHAVLQLFQGDQIWLRLHRGAIYGSSWKYSTFSGYLLYQD